ncbi:MAG: hypothetical protein RIQ72_475 [Candidatus Parcubacteria bacterium]|jgi:intein/homing endonuclease
MKLNQYKIYAIGLIVSDGSLHKNRPLITFTSKDIDQIHNFITCLGLNGYKIGVNVSSTGNKSFRIQFTDRTLYNYLIYIGVAPNKSKTISEVKVPRIYFNSFLRGVFDGDGSCFVYKDKRWPNAKSGYISFASGSRDFLLWIQNRLSILNIRGCITVDQAGKTHQLKFATTESKVLAKYMYSRAKIYLNRKRLKINELLGIIAKSPKSDMRE